MQVQEKSEARRVLVVDDRRDAADSLVMLLKEHRQEAVAAYNGPSALRIAGDFHPEIVFLDLVMPGMDGYEVALRLREQEKMHTTRMVIVAVTGHDEPAYREAAAEAGFDKQLGKPASAAQLLEILQAH